MQRPKRNKTVSCNNTTSSEEFTFLYDYLKGTGAHNFNESVTIGFLGAYGQAQVVLGALPLAIEAVNNNKGTKIYSFIHSEFVIKISILSFTYWRTK